jgi:anaerobic selenocysteine-containing dehydrogenase
MTEIVAYRTCPLCEATCGLEITLENGCVAGIRGDEDDVFSKGYLCPKGAALGELHEDPDRLAFAAGEKERPIRTGILGRGVPGRGKGA